MLLRVGEDLELAGWRRRRRIPCREALGGTGRVVAEIVRAEQRVAAPEAGRQFVEPMAGPGIDEYRSARALTA